MIYYVDDLADTIKFYHSLLKNNGRLMIIVEAGWSDFTLTQVTNTILWHVYIMPYIYVFLKSESLNRKRWLGHPVEDLQEGAVCACHHPVSLLK